MVIKMKIGIIGAMQEEINSLLKVLEDVKSSEISGLTIYEGKLFNKDVCVVKSGIGKVFAGVTAQILINNFKVTHLINTGLAGGIKKGMKVGDIVISTYTEFFDVTPSVLKQNFPSEGVYYADEKLVQIAKLASQNLKLDDRTHIGHITTGDRFITDSKEKQELVSRTTAYCNDMEGGAIAQIAYMNNAKFLVVRIISDLADEDATEVYFDFKENAPKLCNDIIIEMVKNI